MKTKILLTENIVVEGKPQQKGSIVEVDSELATYLILEKRAVPASIPLKIIEELEKLCQKAINVCPSKYSDLYDFLNRIYAYVRSLKIRETKLEEVETNPEKNCIEIVMKKPLLIAKKAREVGEVVKCSIDQAYIAIISEGAELKDIDKAIETLDIVSKSSWARELYECKDVFPLLSYAKKKKGEKYLEEIRALGPS